MSSDEQPEKEQREQRRPEDGRRPGTERPGGAAAAPAGGNSPAGGPVRRPEGGDRGRTGGEERRSAPPEPPKTGGAQEQARRPLPAEEPAGDTEQWVREPGPAPAAEAPRPGPAADGSAPGGPGGGAGDGLTGRQRLLAGVWPPRFSRAQLIVALLLFVLGLGLAIQVRSTSDNSALRGARHEDLVRILDEVDDRTQRLEDEKQALEEQRSELESSSDQAEEARRQTAQKEQQLGVLAGTVAAEGPGISVDVSAPKGAVEADMLLDAVQELRAAGAEAIQINDIRIVAGSYFEQSGSGVRIDGKAVQQPYEIRAIGDPQDLEPALNIPGGVVQTLEKEQATVAITREDAVVVDALRPAERPDYARSSSQ
ncbi:DUF881 domain-containing protein [Streptomyces lycii]|uniref:DUF881 domain-containing protein n=1 Tax=Streptomyces lycii TaxID=2654337 RepID=A0ABQ7FHN5_9ACTN|nr:DUF881 domain-containing protein [Streptomyces lycii]KAF4408160.1 DUF881 domain-containing protein [Streptomyces lycii]